MRARATRLVLLTALTLCCFAANSILCREALAGRTIDAPSFTALRLASGAVALGLLARLLGGARPRGSVGSALALFAYALCFSVAYLRIEAGAGALILFAAVQLSMVGGGLLRGERPTALEWLGIAIALAGLVGLTWRGLGAPDARGSALMVVAGVAWGVYSLRGRGASAPLALTAGNFALSLPLALGAGAYALIGSGIRMEARGLVLAILSGAFTTGFGYVIWYSVLPSLGATRAAVLQLSVPVLAAAAGVLLLGERLDARLLLAGGAILAGIAIALAGGSGRRSARQGP